MKTAYYFKNGRWWTDIPVQDIPSSVLEDVGNELSDNGAAVMAMEDPSQTGYLIGCLTKHQVKVAYLLSDGYSRKEIAEKLRISLQAVHQIIPRMRNRLRKKADLKI